MYIYIYITGISYIENEIIGIVHRLNVVVISERLTSTSHIISISCVELRFKAPKFDVPIRQDLEASRDICLWLTQGQHSTQVEKATATALLCTQCHVLCSFAEVTLMAK